MPLPIKNRLFWDAAAGGPQALRARLERLGPTFVKLGQFLALRPDLIPDEYCLELMRLFDRAPFFPWIEAHRILQEDLAPSALRRFSYIDPVPIAAASLAQVHAGKLVTGEDVAIKIQRPNLREQVFRDLRRGRWIVRWMRLTRTSLVVDPSELLAELTDWILKEIDIAHELANLRRLYDLLADSGGEKVPRPFSELCGPRVLTIEMLRGIRISEVLSAVRSGDAAALARWEEEGVDLTCFSENLLNSVLRQILRLRFFHADLHPGNLLLMPGNVVGFVDFGLCDELDELVRRQQTRYFEAVYEWDVEGMYKALTEILIPGEQTDREAFHRDFSDEMGQWAGGPTRGGTKQKNDNRQGRSHFGQAMVSMMRVARRHGYRIPVRTLSMYRALLGAETLAFQLGAAVTLRDVALPFLRRMQIDELWTSLQPSKIERYLLDLHQLGAGAPRQLNNVLSDIADGRFYLNVNESENSGTTRLRNRRIRLIATSILSVGLALLVANPQPFPFHENAFRGVLLAALVLTYIAVFVQMRRLR